MPALVFDKCCGCIELKTGCFIIGYLNLIGNIILTIMTGLAVGTGLLVINQATDDDGKTAGLMIVIVAVVLLLFVILFLVFSIVLLVGLHQNKPGHLKAYLIYAGIFIVVSIIMFIVSASSGNGTATNILQNIFSILLSIYFLLVIRSQYYVMKDPSRGPAIYASA